MRRPPDFRKANFAYLLVGLLLFLVVVPIVRLQIDGEDDEALMRQAVSLGFSLMLLMGVWGLRDDRRLFRIGLVLTALQMVLTVLAEFDRLAWAWLPSRFVVTLFCMLSVYIAARHVFDSRRVTVDRNLLAGAVCVYLLLGLVFAMLYGFVAHFWPEGAFNGIDVIHRHLAFQDFLYFSFTTLTTAGYGDITPINPLIRTLAYLEMIVGQFYMAMLVAGLVGQYMTHRSQS